MVKSKAEKFLEGSNDIPQVSALMAKAVSRERRDSLGLEVEKGFFKDGASKTSPKFELTSWSNAVSGKFVKTGQALTNGSSNFRGSGDTGMQMQEVYSPLWLNSNLNLPRDLSTINAWCRSFYTLNPFVHNAINLHSTYPISKLNIKCSNKDVERFFNDMIEETDLMNVCVQIAKEYWLIGESFPYAELDQNKGKWGRILIQNPDYVVVKRTAIPNEPLIMLRPDEQLKKVVLGNRPGDIEQRKQLSSYIVDSVKRGENIPLDNFSVTHIARKISPYEARGTGLPVCIFRQLMLFDKFRESKYIQADSMVNPLTLVKIGSEGNDGLHPTFPDLEAWREVFAQAEANKSFKIFTHPGVTVDRVGWGQGIYDISGDITQLIKEMYIGLQIPSVLMDGGADTTYANGGVALDVLRQRYMSFRNMLSSWLRNKIFAPISEIQGFYDYENGEKKLIVPEIDWNHMALFDAGDYINNLIQLTQEAANKRVSLHTLYRSLGLEYEDEVRKKRKEQISDIILEKEKKSLTMMDLNTLRSLTDDDEISEVEAPQAPEGPVPGESPMGDGGMGGLPGMPGPDAGAPPPAPPA